MTPIRNRDGDQHAVPHHPRKLPPSPPRCARSMPKPAASRRSPQRCRPISRHAFADAVDLIRDAKGRVIVTGLGKSGHIGRKIAATLASTGTPAFFVHAAEASHGDLGMITADDVILALSWSGEQPEMKNLDHLCRALPHRLIAMTAERGLDARHGRRRRADAAEGARGLPAQSGADHLVADAGWRSAMRWRSRCWKAAASPRWISACFHPGGKLGALLKFVRDLMHSGDGDAGEAARHADVGRAGRDVVEGLRLRRHRRRRRRTRRHHHRRRSAPSHAARPDDGIGRRGHDEEPETIRARHARQRNARHDQFGEDRR